jgi:hypothetical protein
MLPGTPGWKLSAPTPSARAVALDPCNGCRVGVECLTVATGSDYTDVAPTSGTYIGTARSTLTATKQIDVALPSPTNSSPMPGTGSVEMRRLLGVTQNCRLWAGGRRHARPALRCAEVGDLCTATCFYRLSADTNMRSRLAWGGFPKISADAAKPGRPAALRHRDRRGWTSTSSTLRTRTRCRSSFTHGWPGPVIELLNVIGGIMRAFAP